MLTWGDDDFVPIIDPDDLGKCEPWEVTPRPSLNTFLKLSITRYLVMKRGIIVGIGLRQIERQQNINYSDFFAIIAKVGTVTGLFFLLDWFGYDLGFGHQVHYKHPAKVKIGGILINIHEGYYYNY